MNYSKLYFGKDVRELTYNDVENYFVEDREESDKIEYKSIYGSVSKDKMSYETIFKSICGMLNSEGGIIIWGAPIGTKHPTDKKRTIFKGALTTFNFSLEKDAFINKVTDLLSPAPNGINIQAIENEGKYIHVISIEKSFYSPHQFDYSYYMRLDGQTRKAPHHYVEAMMKKISYPNLSGHVSIHGERIDLDNLMGVNMSLTFSIHAVIENLSRFQNEEELQCHFQIFNSSIFKTYEELPTKHFGLDDNLTNQKEFPEERTTLHYGKPFHMFFKGFHPGVNHRQYNEKIHIRLEYGGKKSPMKVSLYEYDIAISAGQVSITIANEKVNKFLFELEDELRDIVLSEKKGLIS